MALKSEPKDGSNKRNKEPQKIKCENCGKMFEDSDYSALCRVIMQKKPACTYECNKALGQVK